MSKEKKLEILPEDKVKDKILKLILSKTSSIQEIGILCRAYLDLTTSESITLDRILRIDAYNKDLIETKNVSTGIDDLLRNS